VGVTDLRFVFFQGTRRAVGYRRGQAGRGKERTLSIRYDHDQTHDWELDQAGTFEVKLRLSGVRAGPEAAPDEVAVDEDEAPPSDG
jgi:hypothetical protein